MIKAQQHANQRQQDGYEDNQRLHHRVELRSQNKVNQQHSNAKSRNQETHGFLLIFLLTTHFNSVAIRHLHLIDYLLNLWPQSG